MGGLIGVTPLPFKSANVAVAALVLRGSLVDVALRRPHSASLLPSSSLSNTASALIAIELNFFAFFFGWLDGDGSRRRFLPSPLPSASLIAPLSSGRRGAF